MNTHDSKIISAETVGERLVGTTLDGERVYVRMELRHVGPVYTNRGRLYLRETVDHSFVPAYLELSMSGCIVADHERKAYSWGKIDLPVGSFDHTTIDPKLIPEMGRLWDSYHLNGMRAGCIHQDRGAHVGDVVWKEVVAEQTAKCPNGYSYGSKWLVEIIPAEDEAIARSIINALGRTPVYPLYKSPYYYKVGT